MKKYNKANSMLRRFFSRFGGAGLDASGFKKTMEVSSDNGGGGEGGGNVPNWDVSADDIVDLSAITAFVNTLYSTNVRIIQALSGTDDEGYEGELYGQSITSDAYNAAVTGIQNGKHYLYIKKSQFVVIAKILNYDSEQQIIETDKFRLTPTNIYPYTISKVYPYVIE